MQRVQGNTAQAKPLIVGKDTVYVHSNIVQIEEDLYEYDEVQYTEDEYIESLGKASELLIASEQSTTQYEVDRILKSIGKVGVDLSDIDMTMGEFVTHLSNGGTVYDLISDIEIIKRLKKQETEIALETYLVNNPLKSNVHGDKLAEYAVTFDKQAQMTMQFSKYQLQKTAFVDPGYMKPEENPLTWNAVGEMCESWTEMEFAKFIAEVNVYIYPIVEYQRYLEKIIYSKTTKDEIMAVEINFDNYKTWWDATLAMMEAGIDGTTA